MNSQENLNVVEFLDQCATEHAGCCFQSFLAFVESKASVKIDVEEVWKAWCRKLEKVIQKNEQLNFCRL